MTILVTGSTGTIGSHIIEILTAKGADVRALIRAGKKTDFPAGVQTVTGDMTDLEHAGSTERRNNAISA